MTRYSRKKGNNGYSAKTRELKTKRRTRDLDQIDKDLEPQNAEKLLNQPIDLDVAGEAQHYCLHCARYFIDDHAMQTHFRSKVHKRRLKALELETYSVKEAEAAGGVGTYVAPKKRKMETQKCKE
ncbi:zinc finger protein 593 homolog [Trichonephila inaurata madagascariensis]|uniref:Zinc finger protein 593 homolog n=1 Tax=Trichonephila inaurata madagascariensis TaxID=2747483 RepID=A0A8X6I6W3_9ARAC|nr:zinc finger protein 593 homolog [Trichonephila inaurata madagascariensis]